MTPLTSRPPSGVIPLRPAPPNFRVPFAPPLNPKEARDSAKESILSEQAAPFGFRPGSGTTWLRILPPHADSQIDSSIYSFSVYDLLPRATGVIPPLAVPWTLEGDHKVFDPVSTFKDHLEKSAPQHLRAYRSTNDRGLELFARDRAVALVYVAKEMIPSRLPAVRLWHDSYYAGGVNLRMGTLRAVGNLFKERARTFSGGDTLRYGDLSHPETGRMVGVINEYDSLNGSRFKELVVDTQPVPLAPLERIMAADVGFQALNRPIEELVRCPSEQELFQALNKYLDWAVAHGKVSRDVFGSYQQCFGCHAQGAGVTTVTIPATGIVIPPAAPVKSSATLMEDDLDAFPAKSPAPSTPAQRPRRRREKSAENIDVPTASKAALVQFVRLHQGDLRYATVLQDCCTALTIHHASELSDEERALIGAAVPV